MKIANVVSDKELSLLEEFNQVKSIDKIIPGIPTLIIGWDIIKEEFPDYDIINRKLSDNVYWTFKKNEKRDQHEEDLFYFVKNTYADLISKVKYIFVDPIHLSKKNLIKIIKKILSETKLISFKYKNMIYIYCDKYIFGIDLKLIKFIGYNADKIHNKIYSKSNVFLVDNNIFIEYKKRLEIIDNQMRYIPYLYSIKNG